MKVSFLVPALISRDVKSEFKEEGENFPSQKASLSFSLENAMGVCLETRKDLSVPGVRFGCLLSSALFWEGSVSHAVVVLAFN